MDFAGVLKNSYSKNKAEHLGSYTLDHSLSNHNEQVYVDARDKKLLYSITGTHNFSDIGADIYLGLGLIKNTHRYHEAEEVLHKAKAKYAGYSTTVASHSLGANLAGYVSSKNDTVLTLDKGATIGQKVRSNEKAYRTSGDLVSVLNANSTNMHTLGNPKWQTGILPVDAFRAHDVDNIKKTVFV